MQGIKQSVCRSVIVVVVVVVVIVGTKTTRSGVWGTWVSCNGDQTIKNGKKLAWLGLAWNETTLATRAINGWFCVAHAYQPHLQVTTCFLPMCTSTIYAISKAQTFKGHISMTIQFFIGDCSLNRCTDPSKVVGDCLCCPSQKRAKAFT